MRWVIDAMNVIGTRPDGWWNDPDRAMQDFAARLVSLAVETGDHITVVFDRRPRDRAIPDDGIEVIFARRRGRNAADHEIEMLVTEADDPAELRVVTSDARLAEKVRHAGAQVTSSGRFRQRIDRGSAR